MKTIKISIMKTIFLEVWNECKSRLLILLKGTITIILTLMAWMHVGVAFALAVAFYLFFIFFLTGLAKIKKQHDEIK